MTTYSAPAPSIPFYNRVCQSQDVVLVDYPVLNLTLRYITGHVYDSGGSLVSGATVKLFRVSDDAFCQTTTSDGSGVYSFIRDYYDPYTYYVIAYSLVGGVTQIHGVSDRSLVPA